TLSSSCVTRAVVVLAVFFARLPPPPVSTLFPYTTLFRSQQESRLLHACLLLRDRKSQDRKLIMANARGISHKHGLLSNRRTYWRSEEHTSELQSRFDLVCRLLLEKKKNMTRLEGQQVKLS